MQKMLLECWWNRHLGVWFLAWEYFAPCVFGQCELSPGGLMFDLSLFQLMIKPPQNRIWLVLKWLEVTKNNHHNTLQRLKSKTLNAWCPLGLIWFVLIMQCAKNENRKFIIPHSCSFYSNLNDIFVNFLFI